MAPGLRDSIPSKLPTLWEGVAGKETLGFVFYLLLLTENYVYVESKGTPRQVCWAKIVILFPEKAEAGGSPDQGLPGQCHKDLSQKVRNWLEI